MVQRLVVSITVASGMITRRTISTAFVVAWGGMAAQSARLVGLLILSFELRQLGIGRWESIVFWIWLGVGIGTAVDFY
jgi:hypothetical protein